jgi:hypothetical protein
MLLADLDGVEFTAVVTDAAFDTIFLDNLMGLFFLAGDRILGTLFKAQGAAGAVLGIDLIVK